MYSRNPILNLLIWLFTGFGMWGARFKNSRHLLTVTQDEIIIAVSEKERLKTELEAVKLQLTNAQLEQKLTLQRERATWSLEREQEQKRFQFEREQTVSKEKLDFEQALKRQALTAEEALKRAELKSEELLIMKKLDFEQKVKQAVLDKNTELLTIKEEYAKKESAMHAELHATMYGKLNAALITMTQEGDKNTKFVHELMMKIFDKAPALNTVSTINRNYSGNELPAAQRIEVESTEV